ncbi:unnamed protein product, partial [Polarella glacialis]
RGFSQTLLTSEDLIQARSLVWMLELTGQAVPPLLAKAARSWLDILERVDPEAYARLPMAERQCSRGFSRSSGPAPHWALSRFDSQGSRDEAPPSASLTGSWEKYKPGRQMAAARTSARPVVRGQVERRLPGSCRRAVTAATANPLGTWDNYRPLMQPMRRLPANSLVPPEEVPGLGTSSSSRGSSRQQELSELQLPSGLAPPLPRLPSLLMSPCDGQSDGETECGGAELLGDLQSGLRSRRLHLHSSKEPVKTPSTSASGFTEAEDLISFSD